MALRRQSSINFIPVDSGTPENEKLCGKYVQTFAYITIKDRLPVILTKVIDQLSRDKSDIVNQYGPEAEEAVKSIIGQISKLKNEVQTNKPLVPIEGVEEDTEDWNNYLNEISKSGEIPCWFLSPWLLTETYLYRRLREIFYNSQVLKDFDPFRKQKEDAFEAALPQVQTLIDLLESQNLESVPSRLQTLIKCSLWSNRCDLSISNGTVASQENGFLSNLKFLQKYLLTDDSDKAVQVLLESPSCVVDIVFDNAAYELFADLCLADFLISSKVARQVRLRVKCIPWYVSDTTTQDFEWLLARLTELGFKEITARWRGYLEDGRWNVIKNKFWTLPHSYTEMKRVDPDLYASLSDAALVIFKGDLNYRKLLDDKNWTYSMPFTDAIQEFQPTHVLSLRTIKCDLLCGISPGQTEHLFQIEPLWMRTGDYAVIEINSGRKC